MTEVEKVARALSAEHWQMNSEMLCGKRFDTNERIDRYAQAAIAALDATPPKMTSRDDHLRALVADLADFDLASGRVAQLLAILDGKDSSEPRPVEDGEAVLGYVWEDYLSKAHMIVSGRAHGQKESK